MSILHIIAALGPLLAAAIVGTDRKIIAHLRHAGARAPAHATAIDIRRPLAAWRIRRLMSVGALASPSPDRYFLNEERWQAYRRTRRRRVVSVLVIVLGLMIAYLGVRGRS